MTIIQQIQAELAALANPERASKQQRYFKMGAGEYGEGDIFRGIRMPVLRGLCKKYKHIKLEEAEDLLTSAFHEDRLLALLLFVQLYRKGNAQQKQQVYDSYLRHTTLINNWDLVDTSAYHIVGPHLMQRDKAPLYQLARSSLLWERRIAIIATLHFIRQRHFDTTLHVATILLHDREDLIHKAVGWMLREVGKRHLPTEEAFLRPVYKQMPRTMLRYAIEQFPKEKRKRYLKGKI